MKYLRGLLAVLAILIGSIVAALFFVSPGQPDPLRDDAGKIVEGSVSERTFVDINGVRQGMIIQSTNRRNPVLLFLHGGPGMPFFFITDTHPTRLAEHFTIVWWEQRGAGMSFDAGIPPESMTVDQMIADAVAVADYLRARFGQEKIYILGHSWGSFLGIQVAAAAPDRFQAYIGMAQVVHQLRSEEMARAAMLDAYRLRGDVSMVHKLEAAPVSIELGLSDAYMGLRDSAMHGLGAGTTRDMDSVITGIFIPCWRSRAYTLTEKINIWRGMPFSRKYLWEDILRTDLATEVTRLGIPVYFFIGKHDLTTVPVLSRAYFDKIEAPLKGYYTFENSAHSPLFEEPDRAIEILIKDVTQNTVSLSDKQ